MNSLVAQRQKPEEPFIFLPRKESEFPKKTPYEIYQEQKDTFNNFPQIIPMPYPVPMQGNQGNNQGGFNIGRAVGAIAGALGMGFGDPAFSPGPLFPRSPRYSGGDPNLGNTAGMFKLPYHGGPTNPTPMPYYPGQDYGGIELLAGGFRPASYGAIRGGQTPYRFGPYLPYRGEEKREEKTPFIPLPVQQAQVLPYGPKTPGRYSYPPGMKGVVDLTYPVESPQYGQPMDSPVHPGRPMEMNEAEFEGLQRLRRGEESLPPSEFMKKYLMNYVS